MRAIGTFAVKCWACWAMRAFPFPVVRKRWEYLKGNRVDLVLLDMVMAGMGGRETYERILALHPRQKAIVLSGYSETADVKAVLEMGCRSICEKTRLPGKDGTGDQG